MIQLSPSHFGKAIQSLDQFFALFPTLKPTQYVLNLEDAGFLKPMGVLEVNFIRFRNYTVIPYPFRLIDMWIKEVEN